jgi:hypothetical protein
MSQEKKPIHHHAATVKGLTPDPNAHSGAPQDEKMPDGQYKDHWVLSEEDRKKNHVRPVRRTYKHLKCGTTTSMPLACAETYARLPSYYGSTFCCHCGTYEPVGAEGKFVWEGTDEKVGT